MSNFGTFSNKIYAILIWSTWTKGSFSYTCCTRLSLLIITCTLSLRLRPGLRSSGTGITLHVPITHLRGYGDRAFSSIAPRLWNSLPSSLREIDSIDLFKSSLKTHLFQQMCNNWLNWMSLRLWMFLNRNMAQYKCCGSSSSSSTSISFGILFFQQLFFILFVLIMVLYLEFLCVIWTATDLQDTGFNKQTKN